MLGTPKEADSEGSGVRLEERFQDVIIHGLTGFSAHSSLHDAIRQTPSAAGDAKHTSDCTNHSADDEKPIGHGGSLADE